MTSNTTIVNIPGPTARIEDISIHMRTEDLTPAQINMLVAVAEGWVPPSDPLIGELRKLLADMAPAPGNAVAIWLPRRDLDARYQHDVPNFCTSDALAGPIIDRELIATYFADKESGWRAGCDLDAGDGPGVYVEYEAWGPTRLQAAMRAYVVKRYGDVILITDKPWLLEAAAS